uniref:Polyamine oxidase 5 n=1 Tax=Selaginella lepidophylla TaxID=59777 RepID=A0A0M3VGH5_SELLP|nr:polyamine oxidase 5 [Selaginella lepidophylla]
MELKICQSRKPRVVIIGAGISGLAAARRLAKFPVFDLTVLEASHRVGGRIHTCQFSTSEQVEIGATWIHGVEGSPIYQIAEEANALHGNVPFECMDGFPEPPIYKAEGGVTVDNAVARPVAGLYKELVAEINNLRGDPAAFAKLEDSDADSLGSFLQRRLKKYLLQHRLPEKYPAGWNAKLIQEGVFAIQENWERCVTAAASLHDLDLAAFNEYWEFPGEQITIAKGFSSVVHYMAKSLPPNTIQFSKKVEKVVWSSGDSSNTFPVKVHCEDGSVLEADHVIVTVSLGVLKAKALANSDGRDGECPLFQPLLPTWKLEAIEKLGFGVVDKLFVLMEPTEDGRHPNLQLIHRPVNSDGRRVSSSPDWMRKTHSMYPIRKKSNVLVAWFAGDEARAMEALSDEEVAKGVQFTLANFGDKRLVAGLGNKLGTCTNGKEKNVSILRGQWYQNPLFRGSYSYVAVGSSGEDIDVLAEPVPRLSENIKPAAPLQLLFAGEATHREQYSTTHGAYFSGLREAERLVQHYKILES